MKKIIEKRKRGHYFGLFMVLVGNQSGRTWTCIDMKDKRVLAACVCVCVLNVTACVLSLSQSTSVYVSVCMCVYSCLWFIHVRCLRSGCLCAHNAGACTLVLHLSLALVF